MDDPSTLYETIGKTEIFDMHIDVTDPEPQPGTEPTVAASMFHACAIPPKREATSAGYEYS